MTRTCPDCRNRHDQRPCRAGAFSCACCDAIDARRLVARLLALDPRDPATGHRVAGPYGSAPIATRRLAWYGLRPWVGAAELAGRARARRSHATPA